MTFKLYFESGCIFNFIYDCYMGLGVMSLDRRLAWNIRDAIYNFPK